MGFRKEYAYVDSDLNCKFTKIPTKRIPLKLFSSLPENIEFIKRVHKQNQQKCPTWPVTRHTST